MSLIGDGVAERTKASAAGGIFFRASNGVQRTS